MLSNIMKIINTILSKVLKQKNENEMLIEKNETVFIYSSFNRVECQNIV